MEKLGRRYWKPVYVYLRAAAGRDNEEAKDLTQAFFLWLFEGDVLAKYDAARGRFRSFLKGLLRNFVGNHGQAVARLKRGGGVRILPLEPDDEAAPAAGEDPGRLFDRAWMNSVVAEAVGRVRGLFEQTGRGAMFRVFELHDLVASAPTYAELATRLGIKESDVRNHLFAVREAVRAEVRAELLESCDDPAAADDEWKAFFHA